MCEASVKHASVGLTHFMLFLFCRVNRLMLGGSTCEGTGMKNLLIDSNNPHQLCTLWDLFFLLEFSFYAGCLCLSVTQRLTARCLGMMRQIVCKLVLCCWWDITDNCVLMCLHNMDKRDLFERI